MQTSTSNRDHINGASFAARSRGRGHAPHLSISDDSHHVTETIGFLYDDDEDERDPRQTSAAPGVARGAHSRENPGAGAMANPQTSTVRRKMTDEGRAQASRATEQVNGQQLSRRDRGYAFEENNGHSQPAPGALHDQSQSPSPSPSHTAQTQFPLNDIDYESSPAAVAQELSNLQALRRMSMVEGAAGDPDLPALNPAAIPSAPSRRASDDDASKLFWVPARLHPELAPKEFKTFLDSKAEQIKRRSGDLSSLGSSPIATRNTSLASNSSGLSRQKSMLSREVNTSSRFEDGADVLERKRSISHRNQPSDPNLAELESLVANDAQTQRPQSPDENGDFILPSAPPGSLKRSTKTMLQRKAGVKGRASGRPQRPLKRPTTAESEGAIGDAPSTPDMPSIPSSFLDSEPGNLADTLTVSTSKSAMGAHNFSRPAARSPSPPKEAEHDSISSNTFDSILGGENDRMSVQSAPDVHSRRRQILHPERHSVPQIVETPPTEEQPQQAPQTDDPTSTAQHRHPQRTSSRETPKSTPATRPPMPRTHSSASVISNKPSRPDVVPPVSNPKQSLDQPSPLPGNDTNTSNLSFIPTLTVDKQSQEQQKSKKSGWKWLLGNDEKEEKGKGRLSKNSQAHDNTRLDLLQTSIDGSSKRRETIEVDRDSVRLDEERKKESQRKAAPGEKKEKESFISSLFGGKKSKAEKEAKKSPGLSAEPAYRELKPDVDYSWTRFSILEERAIYRMAHIKLANPRRPLYSQVLLSNFMYSYLAKVQQMHPQMNLPTNPKQQKKQKEQPQQAEEFSTYQRYQQQQEQQQAAPPNSQQQQQQQPLAYEGQYASNPPEQSSSRSSTRGTSRTTDNTYGGYTYSRQQQPVQQYETDREQEMW